jgi:hypothetical protein
MSRTAATIRQADVARVARVARDLGPTWRVVIFEGKIELVQGNESQNTSKKIPSNLVEENEKIVL